MLLRKSELIAWLNEQEGDPEIQMRGTNGHATDIAEYGWFLFPEPVPYIVVRCASPNGEVCIKTCVQC